MHLWGATRLPPPRGPPLPEPAKPLKFAQGANSGRSGPAGFGAEKQLDAVRKQVKEMHAAESKLIGEGQSALSAEVSAKAKMSQAEAAARAAKNKARAAARAAMTAGPTADHIEIKQKKAQSDVLADKEHLKWTKKVADAETQLAKEQLN